MTYALKKAMVEDIKEIHACLMSAAAAGQLLPRSLSDLYNHTRDFYVLKSEGNCVVGCCALAIVWDNLAEIRSLYVTDSLRRQGLGRILVDACFKDALDFGLHRLFTLTYRTDFFSSLGFTEVGKDTLPQKIWTDCLHCPKFPDCDEIAMQLEL
jgi:amino-acid N-acetyltransferase